MKHHNMTALHKIILDPEKFCEQDQARERSSVLVRQCNLEEAVREGLSEEAAFEKLPD